MAQHLMNSRDDSDYITDDERLAARDAWLREHQDAKCSRIANIDYRTGFVTDLTIIR